MSINFKKHSPNEAHEEIAQTGLIQFDTTNTSVAGNEVSGSSSSNSGDAKEPVAATFETAAAATEIESPAVEYAVAVLLALQYTRHLLSPAAVSDLIARLIDSIGQFQMMMMILTGASVYYSVNQKFNRLTGDGDLSADTDADNDAATKRECRRLARILERPARELEENSKIFEQCLAGYFAGAPAGSSSGGGGDDVQHLNAQAERVKEFFELPRSFALQAALAADPQQAVQLALDNLRSPGLSDYDVNQFVADLSRADATVESSNPISVTRPNGE